MSYSKVLNKRLFSILKSSRKGNVTFRNKNRVWRCKWYCEPPNLVGKHKSFELFPKLLYFLKSFSDCVDSASSPKTLIAKGAVLYHKGQPWTVPYSLYSTRTWTPPTIYIICWWTSLMGIPLTLYIQNCKIYNSISGWEIFTKIWFIHCTNQVCNNSTPI